MGDLLHNMQDVYKKWEAKSIPNSGRTRGGSFRNRFNIPRHPKECEGQYSNSYRQSSRDFKRIRHNAPRYDTLAEFKMAPSVAPKHHTRPFVGIPCAKCVPRSKAGIEDSTVYLLSVYNILHIPYFSMQSFNICCLWNLFNFHHLSSRTSTPFDYLKCNRIEEAIQKVVTTSDREDVPECALIESIHQRCKLILMDLKSSISSFYVEVLGLCVHYALKKLFSGIFIHKGQMEILQNLSKESIPFVYLPLHRSLFDYFLASYILHMNSLKTPLIVVPEEYYIPFISYIFRMIGAIFVRKDVLVDDHHKDIVYNAVVQSYIVRCLEAGHNIQFMLEGDCSLSGKPQSPKTNLLSTLVHSVSEGSVEDAYIVPISVMYETTGEIDTSEQLGCKPIQKRKSFLSKIFSFWKLKLGNVRVNFNQPFSLKEFLRLHNANKYNGVPDLLSSSTPSQDFAECETAVQDLANHIIYDAVQCSSLMCTHLLAFLLVTQYRKGGTQQQLQTSMDWLCSEVVRKKWDLGFTGESLVVVKRAVELLGKDLISTETIEMEWTSSDLENNNVKVKVYTPIVKLPHVLELQYYANMVVPLFLKESIVVNALYAIVDVDICHFHHCDSRFYVSRDELIRKAAKLSDFMKFEFTAIPHCQDIDSVFNDVVDELIGKECLTGTGGEHFYKSKRNAHPLSFNSDEEQYEDEVGQQLKIDLREESISQLEFFRNILSPYIESYWLAACSLLRLIDEVKEESVFIHEMQMMAQDKLYKGLLAYEESFSAVTLKNALKLFNYKSIVEFDCEGSIKTICLKEAYNCFEGVNDVIADIEDFRK